MSFVQKSDPYSEKMAENVEKGLFDDDIFVTMRMSHLYPDELYSNTMAFGNARSWLYTGIMQWEKMVDILSKWKIAKSKTLVKSSENVFGPQFEHPIVPLNGEEEIEGNFNPDQVDDIILRWRGDREKGIVGFNPQQPPFSRENAVWVLNHGWRYNRNLMFWAHFFEPVHRAMLNTRYAMESRTFKALVSLGMAERNRETQVEFAEPEQKKHFWNRK